MTGLGRRRKSTKIKDLFDGEGLCVQCKHIKTVHIHSKANDRVPWVYCLSCPLSSIRMMGDEGTDFPIPFLIEGPLGPPTPCLEGTDAASKLANLLPRSPGDSGAVQFTLRGRGEGVDCELQFSGTVWRVDEVDQLRDGDDVRDNLVYKHQLYWDQGGRCTGCHRLIWFDNMEMDRLTPGVKGGGYTVGNVQLLCSGCNRIKGRRGMEYLHDRRRTEGLIG